MAAVTETHLRQLREGDRLKYHGVQWQVADHSTYTDDNGYETEEWLLTSQTGKEYYLLREVDPQNPQGTVHWYIAEELRNPSLQDPHTAKDLTLSLAEDMRSHQTPYPEIRMFNRIYQFESQTEGDYESDGYTRTRITWDYWDAPHLWNLALEAWNYGTLSIYSTRQVQPADFTAAQPAGVGFAQGKSQGVSGFSSGQGQGNSSRVVQIFIACSVMIIGFFLMISGI